jgi:hypothetical protein
MAAGKYKAKDAPFGYCSLANADAPRGDNRRYFLIELCRGVNWDQMFHTLIHEWAHALTWGREDKDHGDLFSRALGNLYRAFVED